MKPRKPYPDFPLFAHGNGQWAKNIGGKPRYFGTWDDPDAALAKYKLECATSGAVDPVSPVAGSKLSRTGKSGKPAKPNKDFPLYAHPSGRWAKKIKGKTHYFGPWADPDKALQKYLDQKDDLFAGRTPRSGEGVTVRELVNEFLTSKKRLVESGELQQRTWDDYDLICKNVLKVFGHTRDIQSLCPGDFERLRAHFARTHGPVALSSDITRAKVLFHYAENLIDHPIRFGDGFKRPSKLVLRRARLERGPRMYSAQELRRIVSKAGTQMKAMIYLGIYCGFGNSDCAKLTFGALDLKTGWVNFPRPKTAVPRRCPLWPETIDALRVAISERYPPAAVEHADRVFITKYKRAWEGVGRDNPISKEMVKILDGLGLHRKGVSFYALRHTFQTIGEKTRDKDAVSALMGHAEDGNDMSAVYSEAPVEDARLEAVTNHVRSWLLNKTGLRRAG